MKTSHGFAIKSVKPNHYIYHRQDLHKLPSLLTFFNGMVIKIAQFEHQIDKVDLIVGNLTSDGW